LATSAPGVKATPTTGKVKVGLAPSLTRVTLPVVLPPACGVNRTLKVVLCPIARVSGRARPEMEKLLPATEACEMVTAAAPVFARVTGRVWVVRTRTLPKSRLAGLAVTCPGAIPIPENPMSRLGLVASLTRERLPLILPGDRGEKLRLNFVL